MTIDFEIENSLHNMILEANTINTEILVLALNCYDFLFTIDPYYKQQFEKVDGPVNLENLTYFRIEEVADIVKEIIDKHFVVIEQDFLQ